MSPCIYPTHACVLTNKPHVAVCRSVKAIYSGELGWFDGQAEDLYPMPYDEESTKTLLLMGGASKVLKAVEDAQAMNDHRWALKLIKIIRGAHAKDKSGAWRVFVCVCSMRSHASV